MLPTSTGAAIPVTRALPELTGQLDGMAIRVPTPNASCLDHVCTFENEVTVETINAAIKEAAQGPLKGVLAYTEEPIVSSDIIDDPNSSVFDGLATMAIGGNMAKILTWYDNECGYSNRMIDALLYVNSKR